MNKKIELLLILALGMLIIAAGVLSCIKTLPVKETPRVVADPTELYLVPTDSGWILRQEIMFAGNKKLVIITMNQKWEVIKLDTL
jgi:hypothetical protein